MDSRKARTEAIVRDILRNRRVWERPSTGYRAVPAGDDALAVSWEPAIGFSLTKPEPRDWWRWLGHWLFQKGGMCIVVLLGLITTGLIGAWFQAR